MKKNRAIGIFDSGLGGLSIVKEVRRRLPREDILFLADQANVPYGEKPVKEILDLTRAAVPMLITEGAKAVVIACNSASVAILDELRGRYPDTAFIGVVPAVKPAAEISKTGTIAVFATRTTLKSSIYRELKAKHAKNTNVIDIPSPTWVDMVESGVPERSSLEGPVSQALSSGADVLVLGCTHFPFLRRRLTDIVGDEAKLLDSGAAIAKRLETILAKTGELNEQEAGRVRFLTSGNEARASEVAGKLTGWTARFQAVGH